MVQGGVRAWCLRCPPDGPGGPQRSRAGARSHHRPQWLCSPSSSLSQAASLLRVCLLLPAGCLAEQWSGKKGDTAALGGKKSKKKSGRAKGLGGGSSKQRKDRSHSQVCFIKVNSWPRCDFDGSLSTQTVLLCDHKQASCGSRLSSAREPRSWSCRPGLSCCSASSTSLYR